MGITFTTSLEAVTRTQRGGRASDEAGQNDMSRAPAPTRVSLPGSAQWMISSLESEVRPVAERVSEQVRTAVPELDAPGDGRLRQTRLHRDPQRHAPVRRRGAGPRGLVHARGGHVPQGRVPRRRARARPGA
ncbi:hypothetical protein G5V59_11965 [Nocardioides sp. W3-2-3]|uniref:hypothetical protein n=1 Tax=Nocardioides convexus TaxID=2712224 RepID=UPI0024184E66|nr:hypothetical protein [Nocardioides convexus]NHA00506.1 hypothetical protein [Nocardioides convexus]